MAAAAITAASVYLLGPTNAAGSSHREAPLTAADPTIDNTDLYAFASPERPGYLTFIANWIPFEEPNGGPNFYPCANDAQYNIKIDNVGKITYRAKLKVSFKYHGED